ncbi:apoptosis-inducing factor 3 isoform X2 [Orussus abietinus]|uniref:apoptosis-inducing factor 3 isoform X2 n=1 Tax=Orussus abietinus TaxID=222816 RepID=UPI00062692E9|nr:apoptosis-inducing factor 3 isoform X2 [Orussus abietinus]
MNSGKPEKLDYVEGVVCNEKDIGENEMKLLPLGEDGGKILLIKQKGELHAIGTKCTHYGALLNTGALGDGRVRCPWHGACFNIKTGDIEDYPGLDSLPCYQVTVTEKGLVNVKAKRVDLETNKRIKQMCPLQSANEKVAVIVGGGPAGATCAETLRQEGFSGRVIMLCKEPILPYDRVKLSKSLDIDISKNTLRSQLFYDESNIEVRLGIEATGLDTNERIVKANNNENIKYDYLFIATGCQARKPNMPGSNLANVFTLRNSMDALAIHSQISPEKHIVILGLGFIGMEVAAYCVGKCASVTVIGTETVPLKAIFGNEIGEKIRSIHEEKGVRFVFKNSIAKFIPKEDDDKTLKEVELQDGVILPADIAIVGIGTTFSTEWLKDSLVQLSENGSIVTDEHLRTNVENVYAGGDVAYAPVFVSDNNPAAIGHYGLAHYHGKIAACNIAGKETPLRAVPFFWTSLFGKSYRYAGHGRPTSMKIYGSLDELKFFAYYFKDGKVISMSSIGRDPIVSDFANLLYEGRRLTQEEVEQNPTGWMRNKPKDMLEDPQSEKFVPVAGVKSIGATFGNQSKRLYHTLTIVRPPMTVKRLKTRVLTFRQFLNCDTFFRTIRLLRF